ncbi:MAG: hypothetical protein RLZZ275_669, partial [Bacteroidota bacterium]
QTPQRAVPVPAWGVNAAAPQNENGCGCAAQNKNEGEVGVENEGEVEGEGEGEVLPWWTSSKRKRKLQTENCKLQTAN